MIARQIVDPMEALKRLPRRVWNKILLPESFGDCWRWIGGKRCRGYGAIQVGRRCHMAHKIIYEWATDGPVPVRLELDHLCRNHDCVNPNHLEAVTHAENMARSVGGINLINAQKTHCPNGHSLSGDNLHPYYLKRGHRYCLTCAREAGRKAALKWYYKRKEK